MTRDLSDLLAQIDCHLIIAAHYDPASYRRAVSFAVQALNRESRLTADLIRSLQARDDRGQWSFIRRCLSEPALRVLEAKLAAFVESKHAAKED